MSKTTEPDLPEFGEDSSGLHLRYRATHGFSDSLRDENGSIVVHCPVAWRSTKVRVGDRRYLESRTAETRKQRRRVTYRDATTRQPMVVVSGSLSKRDLSAQIYVPTEEQIEFTYSVGISNIDTVRGATRTGEPVLCLRSELSFLPGFLGSRDVQVLCMREEPSPELLLIVYSVAQHWHRKRYQGGS